jgi:hypothetical protein
LIATDDQNQTFGDHDEPAGRGREERSSLLSASCTSFLNSAYVLVWASGRTEMRYAPGGTNSGEIFMRVRRAERMRRRIWLRTTAGPTRRGTANATRGGS